MISDLLKGKKLLGVVGLGYVGLRVCVEFSKVFNRVIGFDIDTNRIKELRAKKDRNNDLSPQDLDGKAVLFTDDERVLKEVSFFIVSVPTPVDENSIPDLRSLVKASEIIGRNLSRKAVVVYESTVYPGVTEEKAVPILERVSGLKCGVDFKVGYSPERINFGDNEHTLVNTSKIISAQDEETLVLLEEVYGRVVKAGVYKAPDIKTAEAAKVIENVQRDLNVALVNELAMIFHRLGLDTQEVLKATSTKWNFVIYEPGLVGGHCIGVDPYYLAYKAIQTGYYPEVILSGRRVNNYMGRYVAQETVKQLLKVGKSPKDSRILIMGLAFKEDVSDTRNTRVKDIIDELKEWGVEAEVYDPLVPSEAALQEYGIKLVERIEEIKGLDGIIVALRHKPFVNLPLEKLRSLCKEGPILIDVKSIYQKDEVARLGFHYWRL